MRELRELEMERLQPPADREDETHDEGDQPYAERREQGQRPVAGPPAAERSGALPGFRMEMATPGCGARLPGAKAGSRRRR